MKEAGVLKRDFMVRADEIDFNSALRPTALTAYLQECAASHAKELDVDYYTLEPEGIAWVLSRMYIEFGNFPGWRDTVKVETWPSGFDRLFALRDFLVTGQDGQLVAKAVSSWLIIDMRTRMPARKHSVFERFSVTHSQRVLDKKLDKLPEITAAADSARFLPGYSDIDLNLHVNNISYLRWILESLPWEFINQRQLSSVEINFLSETRYGEEVETRRESTGENEYLHSLVHTDDGRELARARTVWK